MKKLLILAAVLLCLCLLNGCDAQTVVDQITDTLTDSTDNVAALVEEAGSRIAETAVPDAVPPEATPASDGGGSAPQQDADATPTAVPAETTAPVETAAPAETAPPAAAPAESTAPGSPTAGNGDEPAAPTDFTALSADQCVTDLNGLPHIVLDCEGARSINSDVEDLFRYLVGTDTCTLYYEYYKNAGRILSILVAQLYDGNASYYTPFNLDLATGRRISGGELLSILGAGATGLADAELQIMGQEFEYEFGGYKEGEYAGLYEEQYDRTISTDNADTERVWLSSGGRLFFVAKIFSLFGTEYYEYPMDSGLRY